MEIESDNKNLSIFPQRIVTIKFQPNYFGDIEFDKKKFLENCQKRIPVIFTSNVIGKVEKAIDFVYELFKEDRRNDGTMFYTHFLETAHILLNKFKIYDIDTIIAALLHDTLEDKKEKVSFEDLARIFNKNVAEIVEGVTKITSHSEVEKNFHVTVDKELTYEKQELATIQKIFKYGLINPRIFLVKFADRFHNVLTLYGIPKPKRRKDIAEETVNIYVKLMSSLGLVDPAKELRDLCLFHIIAEEQSVAEEKYRNLVEIHKSERDKFIAISSAHNVEEKIKGILQSVSEKINLLVGHKTLYELYETLERNSNKIPSNYQHFYWIIDIPSDIYSAKIIEQIETSLKNKFAFISSEQISSVRDKLTQEIVQYLSLAKNTYILPSKERMELVFNVTPSGSSRFDIDKVIFKKDYHQSYDEREYQAFIELIEYFYNQDVSKKMELIFEFAKRIYPSEYVSVRDNLNDTYYLVPNGFTILDLAFKITPDKAFHTIGARIYAGNGQWESKSLSYVLKNDDIFELITAGTPSYELENLKPYSLVVINEVRKLQQRLEKKEIQPKQTIVKTISIRGLDKVGIGAQILNIGNVLNIPLTKLNFDLNPIKITEFKGSLTGKFNSVDKLNIFLIEIMKIPEIKEIEVFDE